MHLQWFGPNSRMHSPLQGGGGGREAGGSAPSLRRRICLGCPRHTVLFRVGEPGFASPSLPLHLAALTRGLLQEYLGVRSTLSPTSCPAAPLFRPWCSFPAKSVKLPEQRGSRKSRRSVCPYRAALPRRPRLGPVICVNTPQRRAYGEDLTACFVRDEHAGDGRGHQRSHGDGD
jgi:hypothetical protein